MVEKWIAEIGRKLENATVEKHVVMPNHVHMIIFWAGDHTGSPVCRRCPSPEIVCWFKAMTTNAYIRGVKSGLYEPFEKRFWQRSYYERIIRSEAAYAQIWQYIDSNPATWHSDDYFIDI